MIKSFRISVDNFRYQLTCQMRSAYPMTTVSMDEKDIVTDHAEMGNPCQRKGKITTPGIFNTNTLELRECSPQMRA